MAVKTFTCPNGHQWRDTDGCKSCPVCGAGVDETIGNGSREHESTENGLTTPVAATPEQSPYSRFGRYEVIGELGRGGMGIVYRAFDKLHNRHVALKTLPHSDPTMLSRFKREFRVLAVLDHPNVVKLFELNSDGETWFFTMEIIDGIDLLQFIGSQSNPGIANRVIDADSPGVTEAVTPAELSKERRQRILDCFTQLAEAIAALHFQGIVHRDIKPSNVIVTPGGRVVILDFGLVVETDTSGLHLSVNQQVLGTVAYMSPEQAACQPVSAASDWYSVGVMMYQAMTGKLPFSGKTLDVLIDKQKKDPLPPTEIARSVPQAWSDLCMDLLSRDPASRPAAENILQRLGRRAQKDAVAKSSPVDEVTFVGREDQLQSLREAWALVQSGNAMSVFVEGRSGNGKSALVETFVAQAMLDGAVVLKGRCYEMESVPFKAIDGLVDSLVDYLRHLSPSDADALMPRGVHSLVRLFPVLGQVESIASLPRRKVDLSDPQDLSRRAIGALRELLGRLGDRCPLVVYVDDLQWGDEDSAAMLSDLLQWPDPPVLLFLGTYRSEDSKTSQFLQSFRSIQRQRERPLQSRLVEVNPLEHADAVKLALALLKGNVADPQRRAESIAKEASGNPFFISELVKHLQLEGDPLSRCDEPLDLFEMIWSRVNQLPSDSQRLLAVVSLWGQPLPLDRAMRIADVGQAAIGPLRSGHFIRTGGLGSSSKIETYHDRVRESVSAHLDTATKQHHHLRIAEDYAAQSPLNAEAIMNRLEMYFADGSAQLDDQLGVVSTWYDIAFHFDAAGDAQAAFAYALATAEQSRLQFSLEVAEQQYRIAERGLNQHRVAFRSRIAEGLGDVLMLRGNYPEARIQLEAARDIVSKKDDQARIEGKLGELFFKQGDNKAAADAFIRALAFLGRRVPSQRAVFTSLLLWELSLQTLHTTFPSLFLSRRLREGADREFLAIRLYIGLSYAYFFDRLIPCFWAHLRAFNLVERYPPTRELSHVWASHAPAMCLIPWLGRGEVYAKKSLAIRKDMGDVCGQGQSLHYWGVVLFTGARFDECIRKCGEAVRLLEETGDFWERNMARWQSANSVYRKGELRRAIAEAKQLYETCTEMGDDKVSGFILDVWSRASGGQLPAEIAERELQKTRNDVQATAQVMLAEGVRRVAQNELSEAEEILLHARKLCREVGMQNAWVSPLLPWLATIHRLQWLESSDVHRRRQLLKVARRTARQALAVSRKFATDLPHTLREVGLIAAMQGSERKARKYLDESLEVAERQGAKFEHAQTLLARGRVGLAHHWPGAAEEVAEASQSLNELGAGFALAQLTEIE